MASVKETVTDTTALRASRSTYNPTPWSKKHKQVTKGLTYSLSNSFAEPLTTKELIDWSLERGDESLVNEYYNHTLHYTPNGGSQDLRQIISDLYDEPSDTSNHKIGPENILVFPGAQVALQTAARCICSIDDDEKRAPFHAIVFTPGYQSVQEGPSIAGASVTKITLSPDNGFRIDLAQVEAAIRTDTRYIVVNEPSNPAGTLMSAATQTALVSLARKNNIYILCDEVYRWLEHDGPSERLPAMAEIYEKGLSVVTISKPWGGCGITIGWIACQDMELVDRLTDHQYFGTVSPSRSSELLAIMCLKESDRILERNVGIIRQNKKLLEQFMDDYKDLFEWVPPTAGAIAVVHFRGPLTSAQLGEELAAQGIGIKPAYCFSETVTPENDYFRVGFGERVVPAAINALRHFVDERKQYWRREMAQ